jgi:hypothetical protein
MPSSRSSLSLPTPLIDAAYEAAFAVGKRDMIGAWLVCLVVAVTCLGSSMF